MPWPPFTTPVRSIASALTSFLVMEMGYYIRFSGDRRFFCPIMAQMTRNCTGLTAPAPLLARALAPSPILPLLGGFRKGALFMVPGNIYATWPFRRRRRRDKPDGHACTLPKMHPPFRRGGGAAASRPMFKENSLALWLPFLPEVKTAIIHLLFHVNLTPVPGPRSETLIFTSECRKAERVNGS